MRLNEKERRAYDKYWDTISYERSLISGKLAEGRSEEKKAGISVMLEDGLNIETIAKYSRISIEETRKIIDEIEKEKKGGPE